MPRRASPSPARGKRRERTPSRSPSGGRHSMRTDRRDDARAASQAQADKARAAAKAKSVKKARKDIFAAELGYKDESNPFGDATLTDKFVWRKKNEYLQAAGLFKRSSQDADVARIQSKVQEIHAVKKRRDEREVERQLLEKQREEHDRERHDEEYDDWKAKEERFHLENAKARSMLRIEQGRERPIDLVAKALMVAEGEEFEDMSLLDKPPHQLFVQMSTDEVEGVMADVETFIKTDSGHRSFWKAMLVVSQDALEQKQRERVGGASGEFGAGVAEGVSSEIHELLSSKSRRELEDMLVEIKGSMSKGGDGMDTQFFDAVASKIPLFVARAEIESWHSKAIRKAEAWKKANEPELAAPPTPEPEEMEDEAPKVGMWDDLPSGPAAGDGLSPVLEPLSALDEETVKGAFSPVLEPLKDFDPQDLLDPEEDERIMRQVRQTIRNAFGVDDPRGGAAEGELDRSAEDEMVRREQSRGFGKDEAGFNAKGKGEADDFHGELDLPKKHYEWEDKYKPRKPRFFNRVKTGFEWNKYNQTHYDHDNPPPKMVQGYKFNIFYPDLIDKTKAPTYYVEKNHDDESTVTLRFHAGPPYEDVAFKIVNQEWNLSHKFGMRVVFDRGVLQLYFNFKRWRYRR